MCILYMIPGALRDRVSSVRKKFKDAIRFLSRREKWKYLSLLLARTLSTVFDIFSILLVGLIASLLTQFSASTVPLWLREIVDRLPPGRFVFYAFVLLALVLLARSALSAIANLLMSTFLARIEARVATKIAGKSFLQSVEDRDSESLGSLFWAGLGSTTAAVSRRLTHFSTIAAEFVGVLSVISLLVILGYRSVLAVSLVLGSAATVVFLLLSKVVKRHNEKLALSAQSASDVLDQIVDNRRELIVYGRQTSYLEAFYRIRTVLARGEGINAFYGSIPRTFIELTGFLSLGLFLIVLLPQSASDAGNIQEFASVFFGLLRISASLLPLQRAIIELHGDQYLAEASNESYSDDLVGSKLNVSDPQIRVWGQKPLVPAVSLNLVRFSYPRQDSQGLEADISIPPGAMCAVIGPSGSGKTTLLNLIAGFLRPIEGIVEIGDLPPATFMSQRPGTLAYVPQNPGLVLGSIEENIVLGEPVDTNRLLKALDFSGLNSIGGLNGFAGAIEVGGVVKKLSGGQLQRIGLARAFYREPSLLILDEATSSLDARAESEVFDKIAVLGSSVTKIVTSHRPNPLRKADFVVVVESGVVKAYGSLAEAIKRDTYARRFFGS